MRKFSFCVVLVGLIASVNASADAMMFRCRNNDRGVDLVVGQKPRSSSQGIIHLAATISVDAFGKEDGRVRVQGTLPAESLEAKIENYANVFRAILKSSVARQYLTITTTTDDESKPTRAPTVAPAPESTDPDTETSGPVAMFEVLLVPGEDQEYREGALLIYTVVGDSERLTFETTSLSCEII